MDIKFTEKKPSYINLSQLKTGDLFKFVGNTDLVYMRTDDGYINLNCGTEVAEQRSATEKYVEKLEGQLTVWEA